MSRAIVALGLAVALVGCGRKSIDPCAGETAACVAVHLDPSAGVQKLDSISIHVAGGGIDEMKSSGLAAGGSFELPVAVALVFSNITDAAPVTLNIDVDGSVGGSLFAGGSAQVNLAANQHAAIHVTLTAGGIVTPPDLGGDDMATCATGHHQCGGTCVDDTSIANCGTSCMSCPIGANATSATCDGTSCGLACMSGFHVCSAMCVSGTSPDSCNQSCTPCTAPTGGTATCDGTQCGGSCPSGQKLCAGVCIPSAMACNGTCPTGTHDCSGNCFANDSVNSCGMSCTPCPVPVNATNAVCTGAGMCDFACATNYKKCGSGCIPVTGCCGDADCAQPTNGMAVCNTTTNICVVTCNSTYVNCGGLCKPIGDVSSCGPSCLTCTAPTNAMPTCNGTSCDFACNSGYVRSGSSCVPCGADGSACCAGNTCNSPLVCGGGTCKQRVLTWTKITSGTTASLSTVWVDSQSRATAGGATATVVYCPDAVSCGPNALPTGTGDIGGIWGLGSSIYASDSNGNVYSSNSFGAWLLFSPATSPDPVPLSQISGDSNGNLYIGDGLGKLLRYKSATTTWSVVSSTPKMANVYGVWANGSNVYAVGQNPGALSVAGAMRSHDGGQTFTNIGGPSGLSILYSAWGMANGTVYVVGGAGAVYHVTIASDTYVAETATEANAHDLLGVWGSDVGGYLYAVGRSGTIVRSIGDGKWHAETSGTTNDLVAVFGDPTGTVVFAVGDSGTVLRGH